MRPATWTPRRDRHQRLALRWRARQIGQRVRGTRDLFLAPHTHFWCDTDDGVRLAGTLLGERREGTAIVLVHGFLGFRQKERGRLLAETLSRRFAVLAFDLRGHGQSGGSCAGGGSEALDVRAVARHARARGFDRVVTVGWSLGGIAVIQEAARFHGSDAVVAISAPAVPHLAESTAVRRAKWLFVSPLGRRLAERVLGTRITLDFGEMAGAEPPADLVGQIAPTPLLLVHGTDDRFFPPSEAEMLYARAGDPKRLVLLPDFGHAEDGFTPEFCLRLADEIEDLLGPSKARGAARPA
ncbi:MAG: alpha/beta hydrolase [Acidobacteria bacterium]|nr:alpha/beta hydrolase [Acidobacteriota bacterium]